MTTTTSLFTAMTQPALIDLYRAARADADLTGPNIWDVNVPVQVAYERAVAAAFPWLTREQADTIMSARDYYAANRLGGGNPEAVIMREIIEGRNTPQAWSTAYNAARGGGFSGQVARNMERAGILAVDESGAWSLTVAADAWIIESVAEHRAASGAS
jgi:hypothetical protein